MASDAALARVLWDYHRLTTPVRPADVIVAATATAAVTMELDDTGTITVGKSADFVVLEANPLDDITNTRGIIDTYLAGELVAR